MKIVLEPGKYVIAVSGGVDSMALLDMLAHRPELKLVVAHFDHGIRQDSAKDRQLVQHTATAHGLPFVFAEGRLGPDASEQLAREARYEFLHGVKRAAGARAILTAHHQDDMIETAIINLLRGTGRRGLTALGEREGLRRPLLGVTKRQLHAYALSHKLRWREDSTNDDETYLRNYIRRRVLPRFSIAQRGQLIDIIRSSAETNRQLDAQLINYLHSQPKHGVLERSGFIRLPHKVAREVLASWLRASGVRSFDKKTLERLVAAAKTGRPGSRADINQGHRLAIYRDKLALVPAER